MQMKTRVFLYSGDVVDGKAEPMKRARKGRKPASKKTNATNSEQAKRHLPQRVFATTTMNSLGAVAPVVFSKPVAGLGVRHLAKIPFRSISVYPGTGLEQQAQLWLYDPKHVSAQLIWEEYYIDVLIPFLKRQYTSVFVAPRQLPLLSQPE